MINYTRLGQKILREGHVEKTRVGDTISLHNQVLEFDLQKEFPLMTTKHVGQKSIIAETLWYLKGTTNIKYLNDNGVHVWDKFADVNGEIGKTYSYQFRNFAGIDQFMDVIKKLNNNTITDRRAIINLYNVGELDQMSIPPCIPLIQFNKYSIDEVDYVNSSIYQRSADFCLGVPYDIAEMALLTEIVATYTHARANSMSIFYSNIHVYKAHVETLNQQIMDTLILPNNELPVKLILDKDKILANKPEDLQIEMFSFQNIPKNRKKYVYELF